MATDLPRTGWLHVGLRVALCLPVVALAMQLCGLFYSPVGGSLEHAILEQALVVGWRVDQALSALPLVGLFAVGVVGLAAGLLLFGVVGPLDPLGAPLASESPAPPGLRVVAGVLQDVVGLGLAAVLGCAVLFGLALAPLSYAVLVVACFGARTGRARYVDRRAARVAGGLVLLGALGATLFVASMLATGRDGTLYDHATGWLVSVLGGTGSWGLAGLSVVLAGAVCVLALRHPEGSRAAPALAGAGLGLLALQAPGVGAAGALIWAAIGCAVLALSVLGSRAGLPLMPDPLVRPGRWPRELGLLALLALGTTAGNMAVEVPSCPDADREGVRLIAEDRTAFDLDFDGRSHLAVVQREEGVLRIHELREDGAAELLHEIQAQEGDLEEVFALPGGRGFLATEILDEEPKTLLLLVDPVSGRRAEGRFAGMCWVSSVAWDPRRSEALLGCETSPDLFAFDPEAMAVRTVGKLPGWADAEDLWLREDGELLYSVSLAEGDALRWIDPSTATVLREQPIGGFNYSVLHDPPTDRVFVARFHDSSVLAFDGETGAEQGRVRVGFGVRPLEPVPGRRLLLAASMFGGTVSFLDPDELKVRERVRLGGRVKGLAVAPAGDRAWLSSTCGTFELDLDRLAPGEAGGRQ